MLRTSRVACTCTCVSGRGAGASIGFSAARSILSHAGHVFVAATVMCVLLVKLICISCIDMTGRVVRQAIIACVLCLLGCFHLGGRLNSLRHGGSLGPTERSATTRLCSTSRPEAQSRYVRVQSEVVGALRGVRLVAAGLAAEEQRLSLLRGVVERLLRWFGQRGALGVATARCGSGRAAQRPLVGWPRWCGLGVTARLLVGVGLCSPAAVPGLQLRDFLGAGKAPRGALVHGVVGRVGVRDCATSR